MDALSRIPTQDEVYQAVDEEGGRRKLMGFVEQLWEEYCRTSDSRLTYYDASPRQMQPSHKEILGKIGDRTEYEKVLKRIDEAMKIFARYLGVYGIFAEGQSSFTEDEVAFADRHSKNIMKMMLDPGLTQMVGNIRYGSESPNNAMLRVRESVKKALKGDEEKSSDVERLKRGTLLLWEEYCRLSDSRFTFFNTTPGMMDGEGRDQTLERIKDQSDLETVQARIEAALAMFRKYTHSLAVLNERDLVGEDLEFAIKHTKWLAEMTIDKGLVNVGGKKRRFSESPNSSMSTILGWVKHLREEAGGVL